MTAPHLSHSKQPQPVAPDGSDGGRRDSERIAQYARHLHPTVVQYIRNERLATGYDDYFRENKLFAYDCTVLERELPPGGRILDAGCGSGRHLAYLEVRGFEMHGLDLSEHFLEVARQKLNQLGLPARLHFGDIMRPPADLLPEGQRFDGIILMFSVLGMIQGADNRRETLAQLRSWLSAGGLLIAHVHNRLYGKTSVLERLSRLRGLLPGGGADEAGDHIIRNYRGIQDLYLHSFSCDELLACAQEAGLHILKLIPLNASRDDICTAKDYQTAANGFILVAQNQIS